jgi:hypothetical protein
VPGRGSLCRSFLLDFSLCYYLSQKLHALPSVPPSVPPRYREQGAHAHGNSCLAEASDARGPCRQNSSAELALLPSATPLTGPRQPLFLCHGRALSWFPYPPLSLPACRPNQLFFWLIIGSFRSTQHVWVGRCGDPEAGLSLVCTVLVYSAHYHLVWLSTAMTCLPLFAACLCSQWSPPDLPGLG